jgi:hypothetical protein
MPPAGPTREEERMVERGIDKLREKQNDRGLSLRLEPVFDRIYGLTDDEFLELIEQLAFVYAYQHEATEDARARIASRVEDGLREAEAFFERELGD